MYSLLFNPNSTLVALLVVMILLTCLAFFIPNGVENKSVAATHKEKAINGITGDRYYSITKTYCLFVLNV